VAKVRRFGIAFYTQSVEQRRRDAKLLYDLETELRKVG
jgi:hypothetical protein